MWWSPYDLKRILTLTPVLSEGHRCARPSIGQRSSAGKRLGCGAPAFAGVAAGPTSAQIQQPLALCVEVKEAQHVLDVCRTRPIVAADQLVVRHAAIG